MATERPPVGGRWFVAASILVLWGLQLLFLVFLQVSVRAYLQRAVLTEVESALDRFLAHNRPFFLGQDVYSSALDERSLDGLTFVRIITREQHLLFSASSGVRLDFQALAQLDPHTGGSWIGLGETPPAVEPVVWNIVSRSLGDGVVVQAGSPDQFLHGLYRRLLRYLIWAALPALGVAVLVALAAVRMSLNPLHRLRRHLQAFRSGSSSLPGGADQGLPPYGEIYGQINRIIMQNRQLVNEMQQSLDNVAHDLRTPMTRLRSVAEYGLQAGTDHDKLREALSDCLEEAERVLTMLKIMMSVAEAETGMMRLEYGSFELAESLAEIVQLYEYTAEEGEIALDLAVEPAIVLNADRTRLGQVWANLLDNAIKYNRRQGRVVIRAAEEGGMVRVSFRDTGIGISEQEIDRIWERLYRGDRSRTRPGLGLGLNLVRAVVEAHGGSVGVQSELNGGSTFTVSLPVSGQAA